MKLGFECDMRWEDLEGFGNRRRHCGQCNKDVHDLSAMTRGEAKRLRWMEGSCVRFATVDGRIIHRGDPMEHYVQLRGQRLGAQHLVAAALCVHTALVLVCDAVDVPYDPIGVAAHAVTDWSDRSPEVSVDPSSGMRSYEECGLFSCTRVRVTMGANSAVVDQVTF